jgi:hypothetical protein
MSQSRSPLPDAPPRFCPRCARESPGYDELCRYCGERNEPQGFCPVCEAYCLQPVGSDCPKHDLTLESGPPEPQGHAELGERPEWRTLARFPTRVAAEGPRLRLEAEGIPTFLDGVRMATDVVSHPAIGGVKLQVPARLLDEARVLLDQTWDVPHDDDLDDAWEELGPEPGARRRRIMQGAIVLILALPLLPFVVELVLGLLRAAGR